MQTSTEPSLPYEVAVVIPSYNCASFLASALDSVLRQTYRDFRIFVIDDGSIDATGEVMRLYSDRSVCLRQPHAGAAAARNRGISISSSPYIAFLDADDLWLPTKLERQVHLLSTRPDVGLVCSDFSISGARENIGSYFERVRVPADGRMFEHLVRECFVSTSCVVVRRRAIEEVGLFEESLAVSEDFNLWLRIASRWNVAVAREVLVAVRSQSQGLSASPGTAMRLSSGLAALQHVMSACSGISRSEQRALRRAIADSYYVNGSHQLASGVRGLARGHLATALWHRPFHWRALTKLGSSFLPASAFKFLVGLHHRAFR
jgi:glycosyltransferase involved in cell wall biosynthesis